MRFVGVTALGVGAFLIVAGLRNWKLSEIASIGLKDVSPF